MRRSSNPMRNVIWTTWLEKIDGEAYVAIATAQETHRGCIYAAGTFLLVNVGTHRYTAMHDAREKLLDEMRRRVLCRPENTGGFYQNRFGMPLVGYVRDLRR